MANEKSAAQRLLSVTIMWLFVGIINSVVLALLFANKSLGAGWTLRVGLTCAGAALAFVVAARFARRRHRLVEAGPNDYRA